MYWQALPRDIAHSWCLASSLPQLSVKVHSYRKKTNSALSTNELLMQPLCIFPTENACCPPVSTAGASCNTTCSGPIAQCWNTKTNLEVFTLLHRQAERLEQLSL